jgi:hypothetical protein
MRTSEMAKMNENKTSMSDIKGLKYGDLIQFEPIESVI